MNRIEEGATRAQGPDRRTVLKSLGAAGLAAAASSLLPVRAAAAVLASDELSIDWSQIARVSKTTASLKSSSTR